MALRESAGCSSSSALRLPLRWVSGILSYFLSFLRILLVLTVVQCADGGVQAIPGHEGGVCGSISLWYEMWAHRRLVSSLRNTPCYCIISSPCSESVLRSRLCCWRGNGIIGQAVAAAASIGEGTLDSDLKKFLKKHIAKKGLKDEVCANMRRGRCRSYHLTWRPHTFGCSFD